MKFDTLAQILAHEFVGNHHSDSEAFNAIEDFAADANNGEVDRAMALWHMGSKGMGLTPKQNMEFEAPAVIVAEFMAQRAVAQEVQAVSRVEHKSYQIQINEYQRDLLEAVMDAVLKNTTLAAGLALQKGEWEDNALLELQCLYNMTKDLPTHNDPANTLHGFCL